MNVILDIPPNGYFSAHTSSVGTTEDEVMAVKNGEATKDVVVALATRLQNAAANLHMAPPAGSC